ncbi:hypothetical protein [Desulfonatronovibrio magnus]|uniref:hypothetical protein n=1 Tax=Desulfonatronovibrio magnus TaxID=698827 RepID=UPI0012F8F863|nr:hypothetical protein [Desulfonatronovibrio magnus]
MFELKISVNGKSSTLDFEAADEILYSIPEKRKYNRIIAEFAKSSLPQARMEVAGRESISREVVNILVEDNQIDVLRNLVSNRKARKMIPENSLLRLIKTEDYEILETVADNMHAFSMCDPDILAKRLCRSENPRVRHSLAEDQLLDKRIMEILSNDYVGEVAAKAKETLESIEVEVGEEDLELEVGDDEESEEW